MGGLPDHSSEPGFERLRLKLELRGARVCLKNFSELIENYPSSAHEQHRDRVPFRPSVDRERQR
jgi:hypothetical protein